MSSDARDELLRAYQRELSYLRHMGAEFAARYPKIAARLDLSADACADPHVERLIESFAFLTARLQRQIDNEFPQFTGALLNVLYPHLLQPVPSMSVAQFEVDPEQGLPLSGFTVPRGARLFAQTETGAVCRFRTAAPVTLWPVELTSAQLEGTESYPFLDRYPKGIAMLRLRLAAITLADHPDEARGHFAKAIALGARQDQFATVPTVHALFATPALADLVPESTGGR